MREAVERRERRDKRKREKQFERLLRSHKDRITTDSAYDDSVRELLAEEAAFKAIADDAERKTLFERYVERLKHHRPTDVRHITEIDWHKTYPCAVMMGLQD